MYLGYLTLTKDIFMEPDNKIMQSSDYWIKYREEGSKIFSSPLNSPYSKVPNTYLSVKREYLGIKGGIVAYNSPQSEHGFLSNYFCHPQKIESLIKEYGCLFELPCVAPGFILLKLSVSNKRESAGPVFEVINFLWGVIKQKGTDMDKWDGKYSTYKKASKDSTMVIWKTKLNEIMKLDKEIQLSPKEQEIFVKRFTNEILYDKFKNNQDFQRKLLSCSIILEAAFGSSYWGICKNPPEAMDEIDASVREGRIPQFSGANIQGLALESVRDRIKNEILKNSSQSLMNELSTENIEKKQAPLQIPFPPKITDLTVAKDKQTSEATQFCERKSIGFCDPFPWRIYAFKQAFFQMHEDFDGTIPCIALGKLLCRMLALDLNKINYVKLQLPIYEANQSLLQIIKKYGIDNSKWQESTQKLWNFTLNEIMKIEDELFFKSEEQEIHYKKLIAETLQIIPNAMTLEEVEKKALRLPIIGTRDHSVGHSVPGIKSLEEVENSIVGTANKPQEKSLREQLSTMDWASD